MLRVGIIGYGGRVSHMARALGVFHIPYQVTAVADPRWRDIQAADDGFLSAATFYDSADELLAQAGALDGVMIGTRCQLHTEMACPSSWKSRSPSPSIRCTAWKRPFVTIPRRRLSPFPCA